MIDTYIIQKLEQRLNLRGPDFKPELLAAVLSGTWPGLFRGMAFTAAGLLPGLNEFEMSKKKTSAKTQRQTSCSKSRSLAKSEVQL